MILYSFILYNYYDLYRFHGTHIQIYTSSHKQKTPLHGGAYWLYKD